MYYDESMISTDRLTRDYIKQPLGKLEKPVKDDLEYLFKELGMTVEALTKYFNKGKSSYVGYSIPIILCTIFSLNVYR